MNKNELKEFGKADLHVHSKYSCDSFSDLKNIFAHADKKGLDIIAITDHDNIDAFEEIDKLSPSFRVKVIKGEEVSTKDGHVLALFINKLVAPGRPILETIEEIHQQGGVAVISHPLNFLYNGVSREALLKAAEKADGVETLNNSLGGFLKRKEVKKLNLGKLKLAPTGGSDAHIPSQVGMGYTLFKGHTPDDLYSAIKNKTTTTGGKFNLLINLCIFKNQPGRIKYFVKKYIKIMKQNRH